MMTGRGVYKAFTILFPGLMNDTTGWGSIHGCKNTIRIRRADEHDMIFTYNKYGDWRLEDARSFRKGK